MFSRLKIHTFAFLAAFVGIFMPVVVYAGSFFNIFSIIVAVATIAFVVAAPAAFVSIGTGSISTIGGVASGSMISVITSTASQVIGAQIVSIGISAAGLVGGGDSQQTVSQSQNAQNTSSSLSTFSCTDGGPGGIRYSAPGEYTWQVPPDQIEINVEAWGAGGSGWAGAANGSGGNGGYATAPIEVTPGENLTVVVGVGGGFKSSISYGWGGRAPGEPGARGGGLSGVFSGTLDKATLSNNKHLIIAAGGGGGHDYNGGFGGHGGGLTGDDGGPGLTVNSQCCTGAQVNPPARGGTQTGGGLGGYGSIGGAGSLYQGGSPIAGGGGGYYGGGGGGSIPDGNFGGGGGGSSFIPSGGEMVRGGGSSGASAPGRTDTAGSGWGADGIIVIHWCISDESAYCADGIDNDQDGFIDSADSDCAGGNIETQCANNCSFSSQCSLLSICGGGEKTAFQSGGGGGRNIPMVGTAPGGALTTNANQCVDGIDNDKDGVFDCKDGECSAESICNQPNFSLFSSDDIFLTFLGTEERSESTFTRISAVAENGFNSDISCGVDSVEVTEFKEDPEGVPDDIIALFTDPVLSLNEYSDGTLFGVSMPTDVPAGTYNIIVECVGGGLNRTVPVRLNASSINPMFYEF